MEASSCGSGNFCVVFFSSQSFSVTHLRDFAEISKFPKEKYLEGAFFPIVNDALLFCNIFVIKYFAKAQQFP